MNIECNFCVALQSCKNIDRNTILIKSAITLHKKKFLAQNFYIPINLQNIAFNTCVMVPHLY